MKLLKRAWNDLLGDPFFWLFQYFADPDHFFQSLHMEDREARLRILRGFSLPIFIVAYSLSIGLRLLPGWPSNWIDMLFITAIGTLSGIIVAIVWDMLADVPVGLLGGIGLGIWFGIYSGASLLSWVGILLTTIGALMLGGGIIKARNKTTAKNVEAHHEYLESFKNIHQEAMEDIGAGLAYLFTDRKIIYQFLYESIGIGVFYIIGGFAPTIIADQAKAIGKIIILYLIISIVLLTICSGLYAIRQDGYVYFIWWAITIGSFSGVLAGVTLSQVRNIIIEIALGIGSGIVIGDMSGDILSSTPSSILISILPAIITAIAWTISLYITINLMSKTKKVFSLSLLAGTLVGILTGYITGGILVIIVFMAGYILSYCQLPHWFISFRSMLILRDNFYKKRIEVLAGLLDSSLYWDIWSTFPLAEQEQLANLIEKAFEEDTEQALEMVTFIVAERPQHLRATREGLRNGFLTIIMRKLQSQKTLRDISQASQSIIELQALEVAWNIPGQTELLTNLKEVCLDATYYRNSLGWQARYSALQNMITKLNDIRRNFGSRGVISLWISTAQHELNKLRQEPQETDFINNPYVVGPVLEPASSLFVGRQDLVQQLEQGLRRGSHRPTFFLNGERRMGKSSTLRQLPHLLGSRHFLALFFDLQAPEITSSIAAFFSTVAEKMKEAMSAVDMQIEPLESTLLQEASEKNEPQVYYVFNEWLKLVEHMLEQHDRIILLSFDEFENLENVGRAKYLDLHLLLSWFRSIIQNRPRLALLFSGGRSVSEMGLETDINWSGYFVNVQTFRVGFLRQAEARKLITQPVPDYPIEEIFGEGVVDEIIRVTGCHPFLVQAVCSNVVNNLNADNRTLAAIQDVEIAVMRVLEDWEEHYFQDLWKRTDAEQRVCLVALNELGKGDIQQVAQRIYALQEVERVSLQTTRHTLQTLRKRDLVLIEDEFYQIATPIFSQWVERNS